MRHSNWYWTWTAVKDTQEEEEEEEGENSRCDSPHSKVGGSCYTEAERVFYSGREFTRGQTERQGTDESMKAKG